MATKTPKSDYSKRWRERHPEEAKAQSRRWAEKHPEKVIEKSLKRLYGVTLDEYKAMFEAQGGVCKVCGEPERRYKRLCVDHDHATGKVRGLLCHNCNSALGYARDSIGLLGKLAAYLKETK